MQSIREYPGWRVILGFSFCPAIGGGILGGILLLDSLINHTDDKEIFFVVWASFAASLVVAITAAFFYFVPAFLLSLLYLLVKPTKGALGYSFVSLSGGAGATMWSIFLFQKNAVQSFVNPIIGRFYMAPYLGVFLLGAIASFVMALWVLPWEKIDSKGKI